MSNFGVRNYDDGVGRFMSVDALWEKYRSLTPYNYCSNNPLRLKDPSGFGEEEETSEAERHGIELETGVSVGLQGGFEAGNYSFFINLLSYTPATKEWSSEFKVGMGAAELELSHVIGPEEKVYNEDSPAHQEIGVKNTSELTVSASFGEGVSAKVESKKTTTRYKSHATGEVTETVQRKTALKSEAEVAKGGFIVVGKMSAAVSPTVLIPALIHGALTEPTNNDKGTLSVKNPKPTISGQK